MHEDAVLDCHADVGKQACYFKLSYIAWSQPAQAGTVGL
jgi:hypothetical protein